MYDTVQQKGANEERETERFRVSLVRLGGGIASMFLLLGAVDYFVAPAMFPILAAVRVAAGTLLAVIALTAARSALRGAGSLRILALAAAAISAAAVRLMLAWSAELPSLQLSAPVFLAAAAIGYAPAPAWFAAAGAGLIATPLLLPEGGGGVTLLPDTFLFTAVTALAVLATTFVLRVRGRQIASLRLSSVSKKGSDDEARYRDLFENAIDPIFVVDAEFRYADANRRATELLGYSKQELLGMRIFDLIPPEQQPCSNAELMKLGDRGEYERFEGKILTKDGRWIDIEVNSSAIIQDGVFVGSRDIVRDITGRKREQIELQRSHDELEQQAQDRSLILSELNQALEREISERMRVERKLKEQLERQRALSTVERSIASSLNLSETLSVFIDQVMVHLGTDAAAVMLYDREGEELSFAAARGFRSNRIVKVTVKAGRSLAGTVIARQTRILIPDLELADELYPSPHGYQFRHSFMVKDEGFRSYIGVPLTVKGEVKGILEVFHRTVFRPEEDWLEFLDALSQQASIAIDNASMFAALQQSHAEISLAYDKTIEGWSRALDIRDNETHGHSQRVADLTVRISQAVGISGKQLVHIRRGALLHDIGKLGVPDNILLKPGRLSDEEMAIMKRHPEIAYDILSPIPFLRDALDIPYLHHERWDGSGYPRGMRGMEIPAASRIFAVIDVWDALRSDRPYRDAWDEAKASAYLLAERGKHFDPDIVDVFLRHVRPGVV